VVTGAVSFPLTTREGWRQFVDDGPAEPKLLGDAELGLLDAAGRWPTTRTAWTTTPGS
jgi:hypothetical protein